MALCINHPYQLQVPIEVTMALLARVRLLTRLYGIYERATAGMSKEFWLLLLQIGMNVRLSSDLQSAVLQHLASYATGAN